MRRLLPALLLPCLLPVGAATAQTLPPDLSLTDICPSCPAFTNPMGIMQADGLSLYFVHERGGAVKIYDEDAQSITTILNFAANSPPGGFHIPTSGSDERGLLGMAFHPLFASNRFMFLSYNDGNDDSMIVRYTLTTDTPPAVDLNSRRVVLRVDQDFSNHNGGHIAFGPDGYLYIALGDGGSGGDPCDRGQTLTPAEIVNSGSGCPADASFTGNPDSRALLGSILRIDVDADTPAGSNQLCAANDDGSANYAIPADNPFAGNNGVADACDEIVHYGVRNPWRFSFDRETGDLLIGDVGQSAREEVSFRPFAQLTTAANYGWNCREGFIAFSGGSCRPGDTLVDPILDYNRSAGFSITGGFVYRGPITQMRGVYFFADFGFSRIWTATQTAPGVWGPQPNSGNAWATAPSSVSSFGEDAAGNLYVVGFGNGRIYRLTSASSGEELFEDGFEDAPRAPPLLSTAAVPTPVSGKP